MTDWTKTPPTEPGYYWYRPRAKVNRAVRVYADVDGILRARGEFLLPPLLTKMDGEWWPERIPEPPVERE